MANKPNLTYALGNRLATTLDGSITDSATTINVVDASGFKATGGWALIDKANEATREIVYVESVSGNVLTIATDGRGLAGTTAVAHSSGVTIQDVAVDDMINGLVDQFKVGHTDAGLHVLPNNSGLSIKESGGTAREIVKVTSGNIVTVGYNTLPMQTIGKWDGWNSVGDTWTYASATTITVPAGAATYYSVGDKIKLTQTTVKYFYIVAVADELLTVTGGTDYTVANAAITDIYVSKMASPVGFPGYFTFAPTFGGEGGMTFSSVTVNHCKGSISNRIFTLVFRATGTTGGTLGSSLNMTFPITPSGITQYGSLGNGFMYDSGSSTLQMSARYASTGGERVLFSQNGTPVNFTAGSSREVSGVIQYPI